MYIRNGMDNLLRSRAERRKKYALREGLKRWEERSDLFDNHERKNAGKTPLGIEELMMMRDSTHPFLGEKKGLSSLNFLLTSQCKDNFGLCPRFQQTR